MGQRRGRGQLPGYLFYSSMRSVPVTAVDTVLATKTGVI